MPSPSTFELHDRALNGRLGLIIRKAREDGQSYKKIAKFLAETHDIHVDEGTVRLWNLTKVPA